jgi:outer membrane lipoprotein-sorting protein
MDDPIMIVSEQRRRSGRRRAALVWAVPVAVAGSLAGIGVLVAGNASSATPTLPPRTAQALITQIQKHANTPLSGEVDVSASLGLPSLPGADSSASLSWQTFLTGTHKFRVWADGPQRQRAALIGQLSEAEVVHNGRDLWTYTSTTNSVSHTVLRADRSHTGADVQDPNDAYSPSAVATDILKAMDPSTSVGVDANQYVAGRAAYTIVVSPRTADSTVQKVTLAVDAHTYVPLQVAIYGAGGSRAFKVGFANVSFTRPAASRFNFTPPAGASVSRDPLGVSGGHGAERDFGTMRPSPAVGTPARPTVIGTAWTSVVELHDTSGVLGGTNLRDLTTATSNGNRLLRTKLVNALFTPDGRVFAGAVKPAVLQRVAAATPH